MRDLSRMIQLHLRDFLLITITMGGGAAALTGRAIAASLAAVVACPPVHAAARPRLCVSFISHCLATRCLSLTGYVVDTAVCLACGLIGSG